MRGSGAKAHCGAFAAFAFLLLAAIVPLARSQPQGTLSALETDVDQIARRGRPSVLTVFAQNTANRDSSDRRRRLRTRVGSGVAVEENLILTTASVVLGCNRVIVRTMNGIQVEARVLGLDPIFNVALLQAPELRLPPLRFAEDHPARVGDWVIALGTSYRAQPTQSVGNIAFTYPDLRLPLLQLTNTVYPGNSGGAALNARGELVGLVQGELGAPDIGSSGPGAEQRPGGASFVLPAQTVAPVYRALRRSGRVAHGFLGVTTRAYSVESVSEEGARVPLGALVESVRPKGPAARVGLRRGDLIVAFDRERVEYPEQLARWVAASSPGSSIELVWARNEIEQSGRVTLDESRSESLEWGTPREPAPAPAEDPALSRIAELERQIRTLSRELDRLKGQRAASR